MKGTFEKCLKTLYGNKGTVWVVIDKLWTETDSAIVCWEKKYKAFDINKAKLIFSVKTIYLSLQQFAHSIFSIRLTYITLSTSKYLSLSNNSL